VKFIQKRLLSFRTNSSYDRWWEGRRQWGVVVCRTRDLARQCAYYVADYSPSLATTIVRWAIALPVALKSHLRGQKEEVTELEEMMSKEELTPFHASGNKPQYVVLKITELIMEAKRLGMSPIEVQTLDNNVTAFSDAIG
jgi:putative membrane protein